MSDVRRSNAPLRIALLSASIVIALSGCVASTGDEVAAPAALPTVGQRVDDLVLVDCRLPGQIRQLGARMTYLAPRRAIKTTQSDCGIRGGEFVLFDRSDYATALTTLLVQAQAGDAIAQNYVGEIYEKGLGLPAPDPVQAAVWYRRAAEQGHRPAQTNLGTLYERGAGVPRDQAAALDWYRRGVGLDQDRLVFESELEAERAAFQREIALRNRVAASLQQQLRQASAPRPPSRAAAPPPSPSPAAPAPAPAPAPAAPPAAPSAGSAAASDPSQGAAPMRKAIPDIRQPDVSPQRLRKIADSQRLELESEAERVQRDLHAVSQLRKATEGTGETGETRGTPKVSARAAQIGKLELTRNEQFNALLDSSRRLSQVQ